MSRISTYIWLLGLLAIGTGFVYAQQPQTILGPHIEWDGVGVPSAKVNGETRTIVISLTNHKDCVTVYSPATNRDYTFILETVAGKILAAAPHPNGFQARICYHSVDGNSIVQVHVALGKLDFLGLNQEKLEVKAVQTVSIILQRNGKLMFQEVKEGEMFKGDSSGTQIYEEEGFGRYPSVDPQYITPDWALQKPGAQPPARPVQPAPVQPQPVPVQPVIQPPPQPVPVQPQPVPVRPGQIIVSKQEVDVPEPPAYSSSELVKSVKLGAEATAGEKEIAKYYGEVKKEEKKPVVEPFKLDHSSDDRFMVDAWLGMKKVRHEGRIAFDGSITNGTRMDILEGLNLERVDANITGGLDFYYKGIHFGFDLSGSEFSGTSVVPAGGLQIGNTFYNPATILDAEFRYNWYRGTIGYTSYLQKDFGIGVDLYVEYFLFKHRIESLTTGNEGSIAARVEGVLPSLGMHFDWMPNDRWIFTFGGYGTYLDISDYELWKANLNTQIKFFPCRHGYLFLRGEWEYTSYKVEKDRVNTNINLDSTWSASAGLGIRF